MPRIRPLPLSGERLAELSSFIDNPWLWFRGSWSTASTGGRALLAIGAILMVGAGLMFFWAAWAIWHRRDDNLGKGLAAAAAIVGVFWFGSVANGALGGGSNEPVPLVAAVGTSTTSRPATSSTTSTAPPTTTTTVEATTTTTTAVTTTSQATTTTARATTTSTARATTTSQATTTTASAAPSNPGDSKNCGDFSTWRAAQDWFDLHFPHYGDVARLDADDDGIACESLPGAP